jgi:hypothetical protein
MSLPDAGNALEMPYPWAFSAYIKFMHGIHLHKSASAVIFQFLMRPRTQTATFACQSPGSIGALSIAVPSIISLAVLLLRPAR